MIPLKEALIDRSTKDPIKNALVVSYIIYPKMVNY